MLQPSVRCAGDTCTVSLDRPLHAPVRSSSGRETYSDTAGVQTASSTSIRKNGRARLPGIDGLLDNVVAVHQELKWHHFLECAKAAVPVSPNCVNSCRHRPAVVAKGRNCSVFQVAALQRIRNHQGHPERFGSTPGGRNGAAGCED